MLCDPFVYPEQSRRCPLCTQTIGPYIMHHIRSRYDYQKHHLPPLRSSPPPIEPLRRTAARARRRRSIREREWGRREQTERDEADALERAIDKRRWVYHNHLYAKVCIFVYFRVILMNCNGCFFLSFLHFANQHVASNAITRYRPFPTPAQFAASQDLISRATIFIRRELRVWVNLDVEVPSSFVSIANDRGSPHNNLINNSLLCGRIHIVFDDIYVVPNESN